MSESALMIPEHWRNALHPRRGGTPVPAAPIDPGAPEAARNALAGLREETDQLLAHTRSVPELVEAARAHLDGAENSQGAAVLAVIAADRSIDARVFADAWVAEHGLAFAAAAAAEAARIRIASGSGARRHLALIRHDQPAGWWAMEDPCFNAVAPRIRALIAAADEGGYRDVVAALAECRRDLTGRMAVAFLAPSETGWVDELCDELPDELRPLPLRRVLCSLGSADQVVRFRSRDQRWDWLESPDTLYTAADGLGSALVPVLADLLSFGSDSDRALEILAALPSDEAMEFLVGRLDKNRVHAAVVEAARRFPERARRVLSAAASSDRAAISRYAARLLGGEAANEAGWAPEAAAADLPSLLVDPPWAKDLPDRTPVVVKGLRTPADNTVVWEPGEREQWATPPADENVDWDEEIELFQDGDLPAERQWALFLSGPEERVRPLLSRWRPSLTLADPARLKPVLARFSEDAVPAALELAGARPAAAGELLLPFCDAQITALMAAWRLRRPALRPIAERWFARHAAAAARVLVPAALAGGKKVGERRARRDAETALVHLAARGHSAEVLAAAKEHGGPASDAIEALVSLDPLVAVLPTKIPEPPRWLDPYLTPQVLLRDGRALPGAAVAHLVTLLTVSDLDDVHPGIETVREACDPASLAALAWEIFQQSGLRGRGGGLGDEGWVLTALGLFGNDTTVRELAPVIRAWPGMNGHLLAVAGLDVLVAIGTDTALAQLNGIAERIKYKGLKGQARDRIAALAADRGLTGEQLSDRLVPDLGLNADGTLVLDYGPRQFTVGFDEQLKPYVLDQDGKRRASLPKPGARDDAEPAPAAHKRFAVLKKEVRTVAAGRIERLERAMVAGRRWTADEFRELIVGHPLVRHLAHRLLWTTGDGRTFRVAEDRTLADLDDAEAHLVRTDSVRLVHPLNLTPDVLTAWSDVFADYEIMQPFPQLGRPVHALTDTERAATELDRFRDVTVAAGAALGMERRDWDRGDPQDNGIIFWISRRLPGARTVMVSLDPGISIVDPSYWPEQRIMSVRIISGHVPGHRADSGLATFADLDAMSASELLTDLLHLTEGRTAT
ncbi:DUF4132 domain-containing protein [Actinomadura rudentiformis]|uniref:DUF4132 domain-containing protein n=1 Tax=Actinomadura rudentiformis TaxID=359158 RepID=A0A6H9YK96_9ACTN|nr:DUF4132 domain-containing protein [Actinomadura rudentiformis]KAB2340568.1 DUF4132 domain-containing protein [Actinomadura rudentiformis]